MRLYSDMHRFIPALATATAGARVSEIPVRHHPRLHGSSKYGLSRVGKVIADLCTIKMIRSFRSRPLRLAGGGRAVGLATAVAFVCATAVEAVRAGSGPQVILIGGALVTSSLGLVLLLLGLVGESIVRFHGRAPERSGVLVREIVR